MPSRLLLWRRKHKKMGLCAQCSPPRYLRSIYCNVHLKKDRLSKRQSNLRISIVQVRAGQKIRTDHLQAVAPGLVGAQHQGRDLHRLFDDRNLRLVELEVDNLPRFRFPPRLFPFHLLLELVLWQ
jgi:hypothetical protein